jgi:hypothetical protein
MRPPAFPPVVAPRRPRAHARSRPAPLSNPAPLPDSLFVGVPRFTFPQQGFLRPTSAHPASAGRRAPPRACPQEDSPAAHHVANPAPLALPGSGHYLHLGSRRFASCVSFAVALPTQPPLPSLAAARGSTNVSPLNMRSSFSHTCLAPFPTKTARRILHFASVLTALSHQGNAPHLPPPPAPAGAARVRARARRAHQGRARQTMPATSSNALEPSFPKLNGIV